MLHASDLSRRVFRGLFCAAMIVSWSGGLTTARTRDTAPDFEKGRAALDTVFRTLEAVQKDLPRDSFDPRAIVATNDADPGRLIEWVRRETSWVPCRGALRGPVGVLQDRTGGSLDRALLLGELLRVAGHEVRLGSAKLDAPAAEALLKEVRQVEGQAAGADAPPAPTDEQIRQSAETFAHKHGLDADLLRRGALEGVLRTREMAARLAARVADQSETLSQALPAEANADAQDDARALAAIQDHWFVQYRKPGADWTTADLLFPQGPPAAALNEARYIDFRPDAGRLPLEDGDCHTIEIRVIAERLSAAKTSESVVLKRTLRPAELLGRRVAVVHHPVNWPEDLVSPSGEQLPERLTKALAEQAMWVPMLVVDDTPQYEGGVALDGTIDPRPVVPPVGQAGKAIASGVNRAAGLFDADPPATAKVEPSYWSAEWIEMEIRQPDRPPTIVRREVFDLIGPAARAANRLELRADQPNLPLLRGAAVFGRTELLIAPARLAPDYIEHLAIESLLKGRTTIEQALTDATRPAPGAASSAAMNIKPFPGSLYNYAAIRFMVGRAQQAVYIDRVNISASHERLVPAAGDFKVRRILDLIVNDVSVRHSWRGEARRICLEQGVIDTNAEVLATGETGGHNMAAVAERAGAEGVEWVVLRSVDDANWAKTKLTPDVTARIRAELSRGLTVVVPAREVTLGGAVTTAWWTVDPATGRSLGMTEHGGATMVEKAFLIYIFCVEAYMNYFGCGGMAAGASNMKKTGCAVCAVAMAALGTIGFAGSMGMAGAAGKVASGAVGAGGGLMGSLVCNAISGGWQ